MYVAFCLTAWSGWFYKGGFAGNAVLRQCGSLSGDNKERGAAGYAVHFGDRKLQKGESMMRELRIELDTIDKVKKFVGIISAFDGDFDILAGRYIIDAKSILGIFSVDLSKPLTLRIEHEEDWESVREVLQEFVY